MGYRYLIQNKKKSEPVLIGTQMTYLSSFFFFKTNDCLLTATLCQFWDSRVDTVTLTLLKKLLIYQLLQVPQLGNKHNTLS